LALLDLYREQFRTVRDINLNIDSKSISNLFYLSGLQHVERRLWISIISGKTVVAASSSLSCSGWWLTNSWQRKRK
jgi:hypothetical protein